MQEDGTLIMEEKVMSVKCIGKSSKVLPILRWSHICFVANFESTLIYFNENKLFECDTSWTKKSELIIYIGGREVSGHSNIRTNFPEAFVGAILYPNAWSKEVQQPDIKYTLKECKDTPYEMLSTNWSVIGGDINRSTINKLTPCHEQKFNYVTLPENLQSEKDSKMHCQDFAMEEIHIVHTDITNIFYTEMNSRIQQCSESKLQNSHRNAKKYNLCSEDTTENVTCLSILCGICQFSDDHRLFSLTGLCREPLLFAIGKHQNSSLYFQSLSGFALTHSKQKWWLYDQVLNVLVAEATEYNIFGASNWIIRSRYCNKTANSIAALIFGICHTFDSSCNTKECMTLNKKCLHESSSSTKKRHISLAAQKSGTIAVNMPVKSSKTINLRMDILRLIQKSKSSNVQVMLKSKLEWHGSSASVFTNSDADINSHIKPEDLVWMPELLPSGTPPGNRECIGQECNENPHVEVIASQEVAFDSTTLQNDGTYKKLVKNLSACYKHFYPYFLK